MHEEDYSILWKHVDLRTGTTEVRRQRRLVISSIATVGNYEYGFYWYFYLDGSMQLEVKLTGVMSTMAVNGDGELGNAAMVAPQLAAPYHQHLFNVRLDFDVDGTANTVFEVDSVAAPDGPDNPLGNASPLKRRPSRPSSRLSGSSIRHAAGAGRSSIPRCATGSASRSGTSSFPPRRRPCSRGPSRASAGGRRSRRATSGSPRTAPMNAAPPATTRTSTAGETGCRGGRPPTGPSPTPTSSSGTRSA